MISGNIASFVISPVYLEEGQTRLGNWTLHRFQEETRDVIESRKDAIVTAVTGGGKTLSLLLGDEGFVGLYPNNTLLIDQQKSVDRILRLAFNAELSYSKNMNGVDIVRIYEINKLNGELPVTSKFKKIAMILLSGKYISYEYDETGALVPKRVYILNEIIEKLQQNAYTYVITLGTPDVALLIMIGAYRNFEKVGYALHNSILASIEGKKLDFALSKYGVATVKEMGSLALIRQYLLKYPWFIDEFHLYGDYEVSLLMPVLKVYREQTGWDYPVIFSSATPSGSFYRCVKERFNPKEIKAKIMSSGPSSTFVRGETEVEVVNVPSHGRGLVKWINAGFSVPRVVESKIDEIKNTIESNGNLFIVVDRVNQVTPITETLNKYGIRPECSVAIKPSGCSDHEELVVVGSESISQGIDRVNVKYGIISAYNAISLIQRFGRIGRKTDSKILLVVPNSERKLPIENLFNKKVSYEEFSGAIENTYSNIFVSELPNKNEIETFYSIRSELVEIASIISYAQVSKPRGTLEELSSKLKDKVYLLDTFFGWPENIVKTIMFRGSGFPVVVKKPDNKMEIAEIGIVLRNFAVKEAKIDTWREGEREKKMLFLTIDFEPSRESLVMDLEPTSKVKEAFAKRLNKTITSIGDLANLGFRLKISGKEFHEDITISSRDILSMPDLREQALVVMRLPDELIEFFTYTVQGIAIKVGEGNVLGLFI
ncbi:MAG: hypothetical protein ACP5GN_07450 [Fervidicoccaceae archaeon]